MTDPVPSNAGVSTAPVLSDEPARGRVRDDLDATLFVEAGAGAGKTRALVDRVVHLVDSGIPITSIAAITFTEKAAAELRSRIRSSLATATSARTSPLRRAALDDVDRAPIGTLHAFARRILDDFPVEAGLPPGFGVHDQLESDMAFADEWADLLEQLLADPDPAGGIRSGGRELVDLCSWDGFGIETGLRQVAEGFRWNWDLVAERVDRSEVPGLRIDTAAAQRQLRELAATVCPPGDTQADFVARCGHAADELRDSDGVRTTMELLAAVGGQLTKCARKGAKGKWTREYGGPDALEELRAREIVCGEAIAGEVARVRAHRKRVVGAICGDFVLAGAVRRANAGALEFHDLLVHARHLLATRPDARRRLHDRYQRLLLDEFQDTDPIQLEIAVRLTADPDDPDHDTDWRSLVPVPGRLFIVGDPKQSIYRFRRADIAQYLCAAGQVGAHTVQLTANFRSTEAVIGFTNDVFGRLIVEAPETQPAFRRLDPSRRSDLLDHGSVTTLGGEAHADLAAGWSGETGPADELRRREAVDVVGAIVSALSEGWLVEGDDEQLRPCRPGDICVLVPTRLSLPALERELRGAGLPFRAENASVVYATEEIRELLLALRAADDPTDALALVASLRSGLYGCTDVELWEWHRSGGSWSLWRPPPDGFDDHPVAGAIAHLRSIHERTTMAGAADLLAALVDERRVLDVALDRADYRDVWHRVRFVIDQARAWADAGGRGIRRYLAWARLQAADGRVAETVLPEEDHDAVRVMTVHACKGLQFPITVVSGLSTQPNRRRGVAVTWHEGGWQLTGTGDDGSFDDVRPLDEQMSDAERRRLLYVACTRAVDHLVVSLHRKRLDDDVTGRDAESLTAAELLWSGGATAPSSGAEPRTFATDDRSGDRADEGPRDRPEAPHTAAEGVAADDDAGRIGGEVGPDGESAGSELGDDVDTWRAERDHAVARASRRSAIAATRLADEVLALGRDDLVDDPGLDKQPVNLDLPPWQRGRYGTSIGRAVHGTLQFCDLDTGADIPTLARSQCAAEGILGLSERVAELARSAITAPIVRSVVAGADHWRELFVAAPVAGRVLEGYIDLLVRTSSGLVIVDYKTDQWSGPAQAAERIARYRIQLAAYGAALEVVLDEQVTAGILVRCRPSAHAEQVEVPDWREAIDEVARLVA